MGGEASGAGPGGGPLWLTLYLTDNGQDGLTDTAALDGPGNMTPPDCASASPPQQSLDFGQVTILTGPSEPGTVVGSGTSDMGSGYTRTFDFDASRDAGGAVTGTFSISESQGFSLAGTIDCLDIRGERAMLIGHGPFAGGGGGSLLCDGLRRGRRAGRSRRPDRGQHVWAGRSVPVPCCPGEPCDRAAVG